MAFNLNNGRAGRGRRRYRPLAEINVTPLVDVMLVLLIVFMVTAPLMTSGVNVDLPKTDAAPLNQDSEPLTVSINSASEIYFQNDQVPLEDLVSKLQAASQNTPDRRIYVRGDQGVAYGRILQVMTTISRAGFTKVALLADPSAGDVPAAAPGTAGAGHSGPVAAPNASRRSGRG